MKPPVASISSLTPLRGIAALGVAVFHFQVYFLRFVTTDQSMFIDKGYLMVDLFFIMSGFLIMHVYKEAFAEKISLKAFKKFMLARFARVYPLHLFTLLILIGLFYLGLLRAGSVYNPHAIASHIFLLHSFPVNKELTWNIPSWSISAEWWAYTLFPFLCLLLYKNKRLGIGLIFLSIVIIYIAVLYYVPRQGIDGATANPVHNLDVTFDYGFLRSISGFMTGVLLYLLYASGRVKRFLNSDILCSIYVLLILLALHFGMPDIIFVPGFSLLILFLTCNTGKIVTVFNNKVLNFLGDISYSVYLVHFLLIIFMEMVLHKAGYSFILTAKPPFFKGAGFCVIYLLILVAISALSYKFLEKPCRRYINQKWGGT